MTKGDTGKSPCSDRSACSEFSANQRNYSESYEALLTIDDVEQVSGFEGVKMVPYDPVRFLGADVNFVDVEGRKILSVGFSPASHYTPYRTLTPFICKYEVNGVGEEAFIGPDSDERDPCLLVFRTEAFCVSLNTVSSDDRRRTLTPDQLIELGRIIASRIVRHPSGL